MIQKEGGGGGKRLRIYTCNENLHRKREKLKKTNVVCLFFLWSCSDFEVLLCPAESLQQSDGKVESNRNYNRKLPPLLHSHMR